MNIKTKVAVVILNWNGEKLFHKFLPSVLENSDYPDIAVIVADNGSTDRSLHVLKNDFPGIKVINLERNLGFARGYNEALAGVEAEYFVLLNSDVEVTNNWIAPCIELMDKDKGVAAVQPKIKSYEHPDHFEYAGAAGGFIDKFGYPFCRGRILNQLEVDQAQYDTPSEIFWASGAAIFVRASEFKKAGGFDPDFWAHMEEIDLCWRLKGKGLKIMYEPKSVVYHLGGGTLSYDSPQKIYLNFRNNLWMLFKNLPKNRFIPVFYTRMILDGIAAFKFLAGFHFKGFKAVFKAHISFYRNISRLRIKRKQVQYQAPLNNHPEIYGRSVIWNFFIKGNKKFSDLNFNP